MISLLHYHNWINPFTPCMYVVSFEYRGIGASAEPEA